MKLKKRSVRSSSQFANSYSELEKRQVLTAIVPNSITGIVDVYGSDLPDRITIENQDNYTKFKITLHVALQGPISFVGERADYSFINVWGNDGNDVIDNRSHVQSNLVGHAGDDEIWGGYSDDTIYGGDGTDHLYGRAGNDTMSGQAGISYVWGFDGNDTIWGNSEKDVIRGGNGNDTVHGGGGDDELYGGDGDDLLYGQAGRDTIFGEIGDDIVNGGPGDDNGLWGGDGDDTVVGDAGNDNLYGGRGTDSLLGGPGKDGLFGGVGFFDYLNGGDGADRILSLATGVGQSNGHPSNLVVEDTLVGVTTNDAEVLFYNRDYSSTAALNVFSAGVWLDEEIALVDEALEVLHQEVANTELLKPANGQELVFGRLGTAGGLNASIQYSYSYGNIINITNDAFPNADQVRSSVFREVGSFFDDTAENSFIASFRALSNWSGGPYSWTFGANPGFATYADGTSSFASKNPFDDYAFSFESFFMDEYYQNPLGRNLISSKIANVDSFLDTLR